MWKVVEWFHLAQDKVQRSTNCENRKKFGFHISREYFNQLSIYFSRRPLHHGFSCLVTGVVSGYEQLDHVALQNIIF
jgi:hypothetical protein